MVCGCWCPKNLLRATKWIGIFNIIFATVVIIATCTSFFLPILLTIPLLFFIPSESGSLQQTHLSTFVLFGIIVLVISLVVFNVFSYLLIVGVQKKQSGFLTAFFVYGNVFVLFSLCYSLFWTWQDLNYIFAGEKTAYPMGLVYNIPIYAFYGILTWELYVVYKCMESMNKIVPRKFVDENVELK